MALTKERHHVAAGESAPAAARTEEVSRGTRVQLLVAWAVLFPFALALEPTSAAGQEPWWTVFPVLALLGALGATVAGLTQRRRWGVGASIVASLIFAAGVFACPATGHHAFGLWWFGEMAASLALVVVSARAYLRSS